MLDLVMYSIFGLHGDQLDVHFILQYFRVRKYLYSSLIQSIPSIMKGGKGHILWTYLKCWVSLFDQHVVSPNSEHLITIMCQKTSALPDSSLPLACILYAVDQQHSIALSFAIRVLTLVVVAALPYKFAISLVPAILEPSSVQVTVGEGEHSLVLELALPEETDVGGAVFEIEGSFAVEEVILERSGVCQLLPIQVTFNSVTIFVLAFESKLNCPFLALPVDVSLVVLSELALFFSDECACSMRQVIFEEAIKIKILAIQLPVPFLLVIHYFPLEIFVVGHGHCLEGFQVLFIVPSQLINIL